MVRTIIPPLSFIGWPSHLSVSRWGHYAWWGDCSLQEQCWFVLLCSRSSKWKWGKGSILVFYHWVICSLQLMLVGVLNALYDSINSLLKYVFKCFNIDLVPLLFTVISFWQTQCGEAQSVGPHGSRVSHHWWTHRWRVMASPAYFYSFSVHHNSPPPLCACSVIVETDPSVIVHRIAVRVSNTHTHTHCCSNGPPTACSIHSAVLSLIPSLSMLAFEEIEELGDNTSHAIIKLYIYILLPNEI